MKRMDAQTGEDVQSNPTATTKTETETKRQAGVPSGSAAISQSFSRSVGQNGLDQHFLGLFSVYFFLHA